MFVYECSLSIPYCTRKFPLSLFSPVCQKVMVNVIPTPNVTITVFSTTSLPTAPPSLPPVQSSSNLPFLAFLSVLGVLLVAVVLYLKLPYCRVIRQRDKRWLPGNVPRFGVRTVAQEREEDRRRHEAFQFNQPDTTEQVNAVPIPIAYNPEVIPVGVYTEAVVVSIGGFQSGNDHLDAATVETISVMGTVVRSVS